MKLLKKKSLCICFVVLFFALQVFAGGYGSNDFIIVDSVSNIAYYSVSEGTKKNYFSDLSIVNIQVNDIKKKQTVYIFPKTNTDIIDFFLFEEKLNNAQNRIDYSSNTSSYYDKSHSMVKNNVDITDRKISENIIIKTKSKNGEIKFWICDKRGANLTNIYKYSEKEFVRYYLDAKLKKIIFIKQVGLENIITEIDY
ncbi:hypothetical protein KP614_08380 [Treponema denticola]